MKTETFNLKELFTSSEYWKNFKFEITFTGTTRIWLCDRKTKYTASGYGYDKESSVIAHLINDLIGLQDYDAKEYGNYKGFLSGGTGFDAIKSSFESVTGNKLERLYTGKNSNVYSITFK
jgi:hypothetical protein